MATPATAFSTRRPTSRPQCSASPWPRHFSWKAAVAVFVVFELWALAIARDNLTLNVLMLFWQIEALKQWQMG